jgi:hypothetical protein
MEPSERAVTIRQPSTANLMLDSADRTGVSTAWNFNIQRNQSILNGFFTRIGTTEVTLEWFLPNGAVWEQFPIDITYGANAPLTFTPNAQTSYTVKDMLDAIVAFVNETYAAAIEVVDVDGAIYIQAQDEATDIEYSVSPLTTALGIVNPTGAAISHLISAPDLRPVRYLDFVSSQLTYNQELKDGSTKQDVRDVLCRWYFAYDEPPPLDAYNFPILMGYTPFVLRRTFSPPKQIRWSPQQVLGNITFQVYTNTGILVDAAFGIGPANDRSNWLMTLQVSEN